MDEKVNNGNGLTLKWDVIMNKSLRGRVIRRAAPYLLKNDVSHDIRHAMRVLANAEAIGRQENADMDVLVPAALFHDIIVSSKDSPKSKKDAGRSAALAGRLLKRLGYSDEKIGKVCYSIENCSFGKGTPDSLEAKILQDADRLEATGAIAIMRTFGSAGSMNLPFYDEGDVFAGHRKPDSLRYAFDLFYTRLLLVKATMHTKTARELARRRTDFLYEFIKEFEEELKEV